MIRPQEAVFKGSAVEAADDEVHFIRVRRIDKGKALGLLRFRIANNFDVVIDEVFGVQPRLDIVLRYPDG